MPTAEAHIATERPSRYLVQLCKHFSNKGRHLGHRPRAHGDGDMESLSAMRAVAEQAQVEWSDTEGGVSLPWGRISLRAVPGVLTLRVEAADEGNLSRLQGLAGGHVERFGRRDGLRVNWQLSEATVSPEAAVTMAAAPGEEAAPRRVHLKVTGLATAVALALAVHLGLASVLLANWHGTGWAAVTVLAIVLVKVALVGGFGLRHGGARKGR